MPKVLVGLIALVSLMSVETRARAADPLVPGEILVATGYEGHIARIDPEPPYHTEVLTTEGDYSVAIANSGTVYTVDGDVPSQMLRIRKIDVVSGQSTLVAELSEAYADIAIEPSGTIVAVVTAGVWGGVLRVDPALASTQEPEEIVIDSCIDGNGCVIKGGYAMPSIEVGSDGSIFVTSSGKLLRVEPDTLTEVWPGASWSAALDIDRQTGELFGVDFGNVVKRDPSGTAPSTDVFDSSPGNLWVLSTIALEADGQVLHSNGQMSNVYRSNPDDDPPVATEIYSNGWVMDIEVLLPGCANGLDDDGDDEVDFPAETHCDSPADPFELCSVSFGRPTSTSTGWTLLLLTALFVRRRSRERSTYTALPARRRGDRDRACAR